MANDADTFTDVHERAVFATLSGNLEQMTPVCKQTWEDMLWAYYTVMVDYEIDAAIESQVRVNEILSHRQLVQSSERERERGRGRGRSHQCLSSGQCRLNIIYADMWAQFRYDSCLHATGRCGEEQPVDYCTTAVCSTKSNAAKYGGCNVDAGVHLERKVA